MTDPQDQAPRPLDDDSVERITRFNEGAIQGLPAELQDQYVSVQSERVEPSYLLIYAEKDRDDALKLHAALADQLVAGGCNWQMRDWHAIPVGERPEEIRGGWLREARLVLLLLSVSLIADLKTGAIALDSNCPLVPLALKRISPDHLQSTPLAGRTIFADQGNDAWTNRKGHSRDEWAAHAAEQVLNRIESRTRLSSHDPLDFFARPLLCGASDYNDDHYVTQLVRSQADPEGRSAIGYLINWLRDPNGGCFCAIFGELGMGKTTLCQRLTRELLTRRRIEHNLPLPVYLDLRAVNTMGWDWSRGAPELGPMLDHLIGTAYNIPARQDRPGADQIARLAQEQRGLILFDGLDEVMNRLTPEQCRLFIHRLWGILPPILWKQPQGWRPPADDPSRVWRRPEGVGRLVMTCRSHFFQTLQDQINALDGQQREAVSHKDYLWVTLLPFSARQVEAYFRQVFRDEPDRAERAILMLDKVHDLRELSSRPYNLRLIQDQVENLETIQREGGQVGLADLYEGMVGQWARRDDPKHRLNRDHKLLLMERLALRLWSGQQGDLPYQALEDWLIDTLAAEPRWQLVYQSYLHRENGTDILQEDLRNASFIVREGADRFRFAHTSIMEFFLARALHRALVEDRLDHWAVRVPSSETLDFLGGLIATRETGTCLAALARIRAGYQRQVSELALAFGLHAQARDLPGADFTGFQLQGAELSFQRWHGRQDRLMRWQGANLTGARLDGGHFVDCDFSGARLDGADLARTLFDRCRLDRVSAQGVDLTGAAIHGCPVSGADFSGAILHHSRWLGPLPSDFVAEPPTLFTATLAESPPGVRPESIAGHLGRVTRLLSDPLGYWLASAGADGTVRLWDPLSGHLLHRLEGHRGGVEALAIAPDGHWLASAGEDGSIRRWDPASGGALPVLEGHLGEVGVLAVAPNRDRLASAGTDGTVRLWDSANGQLLHELQGHRGRVHALAFAADGCWIASAGRDGRMFVWDPESGRLVHTLEGHSGWVQVLAVDPDGGWLAGAGTDGTLRLWDLASGELRYELEGHRCPVRALVVAPDGGWLASADEKGGVRLWDPAAGQLLHALEGPLGGVGALAVAPDGRWLAAGGEDGSMRLWDPLGGRLLQELEGHPSGVGALALAPNGRWLAAAGVADRVRIWNPESGRLLHDLEGRLGGVRALAVEPNGRWLAMAGGDDQVRLWDPNTAQLMQDLEGHRGGVLAVAVAPDGSWLALASGDGRVRIWDPGNGRLLHGLEEHRARVLALAAAPDGRWLASASEDGSVRLWDPGSGRLLCGLAGHRLAVRALAVAPPDGRWLASASEDGSIRFWDPASRRIVHDVVEGHEGSVRALAVAPDGRWLASAGVDGTVRFWDPESGRLLHRLEEYRDEIQALAVAPDGRWVASADGDGRVRLWAPASGQLLHVLKGHPSRVEALAVAPDGCWLASAGGDTTVRLWAPVSGQLLHELKGHRARVLALAFAPDGRWLASAGEDGTVRTWALQRSDEPPVCGAAFEYFPEGNGVVWRDPDGPNRRWVSWSRDAWRWLGWHAPLPDGKHWIYYPMAAFRAGPDAAES